jgi:hypothetical protein
VVVVDVDLDVVDATRTEFPVLDDRRLRTTSTFAREDLA